MANRQTSNSTDPVYGEYAFNIGRGKGDFIKGPLEVIGNT
jgi:hypothetical protein